MLKWEFTCFHILSYYFHIIFILGFWICEISWGPKSMLCFKMLVPCAADVVLGLYIFTGCRLCRRAPKKENRNIDFYIFSISFQILCPKSCFRRFRYNLVICWGWKWKQTYSRDETDVIAQSGCQAFLAKLIFPIFWFHCLSEKWKSTFCQKLKLLLWF